jgi:hypothetical protein
MRLLCRSAAIRNRMVDGMNPTARLPQQPIHTACIFCGGRPLTREHLFPGWLRPYLGGDAQHLYRHGSLGGAQPFMQQRREMAATRRRRLLCDPCNTVWGSDLERAAAPVLVPMVQGATRWLSQADQELVARWSMKTAMVFDRTYPSEQFIPDAHLREFRQTDIPPAGTWVWMAAYASDARVATHVSFPFPFRTAGDERPRGRTLVGYGVTLTIGHFVVQVLNDPEGSEDVVNESLRTFWEIIRPIWPIEVTRRRWPPRRWIDDAFWTRSAFRLASPLPLRMASHRPRCRR